MRRGERGGYSRHTTSRDVNPILHTTLPRVLDDSSRLVKAEHQMHGQPEEILKRVPWSTYGKILERDLEQGNISEVNHDKYAELTSGLGWWVCTSHQVVQAPNALTDPWKVD
jgi:hypothetical protein